MTNNFSVCSMESTLIIRPLKKFEYSTTFLQCDLAFEKHGISLLVTVGQKPAKWDDVRQRPGSKM